MLSMIQGLYLLPQPYRIITIDVKDYPLASTRLNQYGFVKRIIGSALDDNICSTLKQLFQNNPCKGKKLLFIDALQDKEWVLNTLKTYISILLPDYIILDDITISDDMKKMWHTVSQMYNGRCYNIVDYMGKTIRESNDKPHLNPGFGIIYMPTTSYSLNVVFCTDTKYSKLIPTVINSIYQHNQNNIINFYIIYNELDNCDRVTSYFNKYSNFKVSLYPIDLSEFKYDPHHPMKHVSISTMLRLFIPKTLINLKGNVLYLDLDIIVHMDLEKIFNLPTGEIGIAAKSSVSKTIMQSFGCKTYPYDKSFNAGVLLMNLDTVRRHNFTQTCLNLWRHHPEYDDQVILNLYCRGKYVDLPVEYNVFNNSDAHLATKYKEFILHFCSSQKPWLTDCVNKHIWDMYYVES